MQFRQISEIPYKGNLQSPISKGGKTTTNPSLRIQSERNSLILPKEAVVHGLDGSQESDQTINFPKIKNFDKLLKDALPHWVSLPMGYLVLINIIPVFISI